MPQSFTNELKQQWKENILKQKQSNLSISSWCRQNEIPTHRFHYWHSKLFPKQTLSRSDFNEVLKEKNSPSTGIILEYQEFKIQLDEHFEPSTLKRCLEVLKKC